MTIISTANPVPVAHCDSGVEANQEPLEGYLPRVMSFTMGQPTGKQIARKITSITASSIFSSHQRINQDAHPLLVALVRQIVVRSRTGAYEAGLFVHQLRGVIEPHTQTQAGEAHPCRFRGIRVK